MAEQLRVNLVTPRRELVRVQVDQVAAPSVMGEVGILPDHLPLLAELTTGPVGLFTGGQAHYYAVSGGFLEVHNNTVTILADTAEAANEIDTKRCQKALEEASQRLKELDYTDPRYAEEEARARRARVRLTVAERG